MDDNKHEIRNGKKSPPPSFNDVQAKIDKARKRLLKEDKPTAKDKSAIFSDAVYFGQVPVELLRDFDTSLQPKAVYALLHSYSQSKALISNPQTFVSQKRLAKDAKISISRLRFWVKKLEELGWLTVKRRGLNKSNYYILHGRKKRKK